MGVHQSPLSLSHLHVLCDHDDDDDDDGGDDYYYYDHLPGSVQIGSMSNPPGRGLSAASTTPQMIVLSVNLATLPLAREKKTQRERERDQEIRRGPEIHG